jgi:ABC-2 type transport system permease protein
MLFLFALGLGFGPIYRRAGGGDYIQFLAPGIISMSILFSSVFSGIEVIWDRQFGFLKETLVAPVSRLEIMLGRTLGGTTVAVFQGIIVLLVSLLAGFKPDPSGLPLALLFMALIALLFCSLGTAIASVLENVHGFQLIMNLLVMPTFFLSGALFPLQNLPELLYKVTIFNPLSYGVDGLRGSLIHSSHFGILLNISMLSLFSFSLLFVGAFLFSRIEV